MDRRPPPGMLNKDLPIVGKKTIAEHVIFELGPFKLHPPVGFDQTYVILMVLMSGASSNMYKTIHAFQQTGKPLAQAYLVEDCRLGKKHDLVMVTADEKGQLGFMVAKPVKDDPASKTKH